MLLVAVLCLGIVGVTTEVATALELTKEPFGETPQATPVELYTLTNDNGIEVQITNYEGIVVSVMAPDQDGNFEDIVLGYDTLNGYLQRDPYFGGIHDRGAECFRYVVWDVEEVVTDEHVGLELSTEVERKDEECRLFATVTYLLNNDNELEIEYAVTTNKETTIDFANDIYFNLSGQGEGDILGHEMLINAESYYPLDETLRPLTEMRNVVGTPMNYTQPTTLRSRMTEREEQIRLASGYQHIWQIEETDESLPLAARVLEPSTKRVLEVRTTASGIWFETGNFLDGIPGKSGKVYEKHSGFTLTARNAGLPSGNVDFPAAPLLPEEAYTYTTVYKFFAL
ncbi:hypothetical protein GF339_12230 [candidate division KSB3 bacterium]|uniref:Aldose 1-epimerase n=1 Tax=candidate division KSB3 bacterium TaxID=2044937 RepID=A0A9D5Q6F7_9BACT|nr:hypothetical protein [candidate division KSB3 bacterium]MBD3325348.1 hypothetical protein [candidate division KSB3 bacterium]